VTKKKAPIRLERSGMIFPAGWGILTTIKVVLVRIRALLKRVKPHYNNLTLKIYEN